MSASTSDQRIYYFLGNITSHLSHALPLYNELGGTFIVLSKGVEGELEARGLPVVCIDDVPYIIKRHGRKIGRVREYLSIMKRHKKTIDFLNNNADIILFYELFSFDSSLVLDNPKKIFLTHGNMLKDYMSANNRLRTIKFYDYMAALGPYLKNKFIHEGIAKEKLIDIGIARTDSVVRGANRTTDNIEILHRLGITDSRPIVSYLPTYWGASSIYNTGLRIIQEVPDDYTLIFRPHPQTSKKILRKYLKVLKHKSNVVYAPETSFGHVSLLDLYAISSAMIGDVSSVMLEAILTRKPLIFAYDTTAIEETDNSYESIRKIVNYSQKITINTNIPSTLSASLRNGIDNKLWQEAIELNYFQSNGTTVEAIKNFIKSL